MTLTARSKHHPAFAAVARALERVSFLRARSHLPVILLSQAVGLLAFISASALAAPPNPPSGLDATSSLTQVNLTWVNPATRTDGTALTDFGGIRVFRDGILVATLARPRPAAGQPDSYSEARPSTDALSYQLAAYDRSTPVQVSALSPAVVVSGPGAPGISIAPTEFQFSVRFAEATSASLIVTNSGSGQLNVALTADAPWLTSSVPSLSIGPGGVAATDITARSVGLAPGSHTAQLTLSSNDPANPVLQVPLTLLVSPPAPRLTASPASIALVTASDTPVTGSVSVQNLGPLDAHVTITQTVSWLHAVPATATIQPGRSLILNLTATPATLPRGFHAAVVHVDSEAPDSPLDIPLSLEIQVAGGELSISPMFLDLQAAIGGSESGGLLLQNRGTMLLSFDIDVASDWLALSPAQGVVTPGANTAVTVTAISGLLPAGVYHDTLEVSSSDPVNPLIRVPVQFSILAAACALDDDVLHFSAEWNGAPDTLRSTYRYPACSFLEFRPWSYAPWLSFTPWGYRLEDHGSLPMTFIADPHGLAPGVYTGRIDWSPPAPGQEYVDLEFEVLRTPPRIAVSQLPLTVERPEGAAAVDLSLLVTNSGFDPLSVTVTEGASWMRPVVGSLAIGSGGTESILLHIDVGGLPPGTYMDNLRLESNDPVHPVVTIPVTLQVWALVADIGPTGAGIEEFAVRCSDGSADAQFLELISISPSAAFRSSIGLRIEDASGVELLDRQDIFVGHSDGEAWPQGTSWLIATSAFATRGGVTPDLVMTTGLDPRGGTLTLYDQLPTYRVLQRVSYGVRSPRNPPGPGRSLRWTSGGYQEHVIPQPMNSGGQAESGFDCDCREALLRVNGNDAHSTAPRDQRNYSGHGTSESKYDVPAGTIGVDGYGNSCRLDLSEDFVIEGVPIGVPLQFQARLRVTGGCHASANDFGIPFSGSCSASTRVDGTLGPAVSLRASVYGWPQDFSVHRNLVSDLRRQSFEPFAFQILAAAGGSYHNSVGGYGWLTGQFDFIGLPPRARIRSCRGYSQDAPVPLALAAEAAELTPEGVRVTWSGSDGRRLLQVERTEDGDLWLPRALITADVDGRAIYLDADTRPGHRYGYRIRSDAGPAGEIWFEASPAVSPPAFAARFDLATHRVTVSFSLPVTAHAEIQIFDVAGRLVDALDLGVRPGGHGEMTFDSASLASGLYFLRLIADARSSTTRLLVAR